MYIGVGVIIAVYVLIFVLSIKEDATGAPSAFLRPFYRMALYVYKYWCMWKIPILGREGVEKTLERLHPGEGRKQLCTDYYVKKISMALLIVLLGALLGVLVRIKTHAESELGVGGVLTRDEYAEGTKELELYASVDGGEEQVLQITVEPREYSETELNVFADAFRQQLPELIRGENLSLEEVSAELELEESYQGYPFIVEWKSDRPEIISGTGRLLVVPEEEYSIILRAKLLYGDREWEEILNIRVVPPELSEEERQHQELTELVIATEKQSRLEQEWILPDYIQGKKIFWRQEVEDYGVLLMGGALLVAVLVFFLMDKDLQGELERRRVLMKRRYPDVVQKLLLYLSAGLTVRASFQKIAGEYEREKNGEKGSQPIYEEMLYTCHELQMGVSEGMAFEHFGKRTGLQEYVRLSTLLMQNIKKGNSTLLQRLREEADKACIEQLQNSRKAGEEAATKLLLPMVMLLLVVMLMIMFPAFSTVGT